MIGTYKWNLITGLVGFLGTLAISMPRNIPKTAFIQSGYSFAFLFAFTFIVRWVLGVALHQPQSAGDADLVDGESDDAKGLHIDLATPEDVPQAALTASQPSADAPAAAEETEGFTPLNPPKLSSKLGQEPEELARALRHMTTEE